MSLQWISISGPPRLEQNQCQVWWADSSQERECHEEMLSPYEKKRRDRLVRGSERDAFTVGCALLRIIIGCLIGVPPAHVLGDIQIDDGD